MKILQLLSGVYFGIAMVATSAITQSAKAQSPSEVRQQGSEFIFQPAGGVQAVTPYVNYVTASIVYTPRDGINFGELTVSGYTAGLRYDVGVSSLFSLGLDLSWLSFTDKVDIFSGTTRTRGLKDIGLHLNGSLPLVDQVALRFGLEARLSPGKKVQNDARSEINAFSGAQTVTPFVGLELVEANALGGVKVSYDAIKTNQMRKFEESTVVPSERENQGPRTFSASLFDEWKFSPVTLGASVTYQTTSRTSADIGGTELLPSLNRDCPSGTQDLLLQIYAPSEFSKQLTLLPSIQYAFLPNKKLDQASMNVFHLWQFELGARFLF